MLKEGIGFEHFPCDIAPNYFTSSGNNYEKRSGNSDKSEAGEDTVIFMETF